MILKRLQSFMLVVDLRSFSDAAQRLQLTQSAISRQIRALEDELGVALLTRNTTTVEPTLIGLRVYERAKEMLNSWDLLVDECKAAANSIYGRLRIGASTVPASYLLPRIVVKLRERYPQVELSITEGDSEKIAGFVKERSVDIAFTGSIASSPTLQWERIADDSLVIVGAPELQEKQGASLADLLRQPFVVREEGSGTRRAFEKAIRAYNFTMDRLTVAAEVSTTEAALALAQSGVGLTAVSKWALAVRRDMITLADIPTDRGFYCAYELSRGHDPLIRLFIQIAKEIYSLPEDV